ncbi:hypothetical protein G7Y89_g2796 [Cudoniella acicularis]|uniref:WSC domain-containing protein n=1 Tax=Cudoniella acicularis TaxID=354080 RepID=A0A8H4W5T7_9HELO|nr:hypothetical protein G7Y89_g2796 [Cudoniella acicularis]
MAPSFVQAAISLMFVGSAWSKYDNGYAGVLDKRVVPSTLPGTWTYQGCYTDSPVRTLNAASYVSPTNMTDEYCIGFCNQEGYIYAGTEYSQECYCDNTINSISTVAASTDCSMSCTGNSSETCGGSSRLSLFWNGKNPPPGPSTNPGALGYGFYGCYTEGTNGRALPNPVSTTGGASALTVALCIQACNAAGYSLAGVEYAQECYCANSIQNAAIVAPEGVSGCNMLCEGNSTEYCGAGNRLDIYKQGYLGSQSTVASVVVSSSTSSSSKISTTSSIHLTSSSSSSKILTSSSSGIISSSSIKASTVSSSANSSPTFSKTSISSISIQASSSTSSSTVVPTLAIKPTVGAYSYVGCYTEGSPNRALPAKVTYDYTGMTLEDCSIDCAGFNYFGVEYGGECWCANTIDPTAALAATQTDCNFICPGNQYEYCGAGNRLEIKSSSSTGVSSSKSSSSSSTSSVLSTKSSSVSSTSSHSSSFTSSSSILSTATITSSSVQATPTLQIVPSVANYVYYGCWTEGTGVRALAPGAFAADTMTVESCEASCAGYTYFGVEYGRECYCGNTIAASSVLKPDSDCSMVCMGNQYEYCGNGNRLNIYIKNGTATSTSSISTGTATGSTALASQTAATTGLPAGWKYAGCYTEGTTGRALQNGNPDSATNTVESCVNTCISQGYSVAGMEYSQQCWCDNFLYNGAALTTGTSCNMACAGNTNEICGGPSFLSVYYTGTLTVYQPPTAQKTNLPGSWVYQGCYSDNVNNVRALFWQSILTNNNTATSCLTLCQEYGYMSAGMEYGDECYCGDDSKLIASGSTQQPETDCQVLCSGDSAYYCGSGNRLSYYKWTGTPLYTWNTPTGAGMGEYQFLLGGVVVPLITTATVNGKVVFMEKAGTGAPNTTGTYELDLAFINEFDQAWRPLHVKSDIFCSAGITLPDKVGRLLNIGGWSGASTYGVRIYWPDGSPGVAGVNDWQENVNEVSLLAGRWYPSAMMLTNGSVLIMGGEVGSNSAPTPSCEILPPPVGGYAKYLDWLDRTDPNNLYPFMWILPTGGVFIVYYNEARILDESTFDTIKTLPNLPGSVNNFLSGRTYPLEGTGVMMPLYAPFADHATFLICGGSANGAAYAVDNCVSTSPEDASPTWTLERMPSQRVMTCICALPDGTYLILNGAQEGVAGFGLASDPNYNAVLYDPTLPINARMSIMNTTPVARLYHSEAILLPDGRVLVSGSDPEDGVHPQEYRTEVFLPPYALSGLPQPSFTINTANKDWAYDSTVTITANIPSGNLGGVRVSMMAAVSSTHGNSMGQRTLFLSVACVGAANAATCQITTPPTPHVAPPTWYMIFVLDGPTPGPAHWVRIGGAIADAAGLGNWPSGETDFTPPGLGPVPAGYGTKLQKNAPPRSRLILPPLLKLISISRRSARKEESRQRDITRYIAFSSAILSCLCAGSITTFSLYGHLFQERLRYTQLQVNIVIIAAELALYLPVSLLGYLCDRIGPAPLSFISSILFGVGYLLAAFTYKSGAKDVMGYTTERGWPLWVMVVAFVIIGLATTCMYLSAVATCAKNFGKGKYRGLALACPIAAFGLSGMWQSQLGSRVLYERRPNGRVGDVDVFKYFVFLAVSLLAVGLLGSVLLKIVDEDELIDEAVEELERSGLLEDSEFFRRSNRSYGSIEELSNEDLAEARRVQDVRAHEEEEARKKTWLLNEETRRFLKDRTMWCLAGGFFFVSGPGEAFITNLGTIIGTLYPPSINPDLVPTTAATHVSIVAITSTVARILFGTLTDILAPPSVGHHFGSAANSLSSLPPRRRFTISRVTFLIFSALLVSLGSVILASGAIQNHGERFWIISTLIGSGYGAIFSLTPLIITVIWGVENFGTNWGIVAMVPAFGATTWGVVYSTVYQWASKRPSYRQDAEEEILCYGKLCYSGTFWAMAVSVWIGCGLWTWAWLGRDGWKRRGIAV